MVKTGFAALFWATTAGAADRARLRRADLGGAARAAGRRARAARGARALDPDPVGVRAHPAPGRRARPRLLRAHGRSTCWRRSRSPSTWSWSPTRAPPGSCSGTFGTGAVFLAGLLWQRAPAPLARLRSRAAAPDDPLRAADDAGRAHPLLAQLHRPDPDRAARRARRGGPLRARDQVRPGHQRARARLPARLPAARLLDRRRRRGAARLQPDRDLVRRRLRLRRRRALAARALDRRPARRAASTSSRSRRSGCSPPGSRCTRSTWSWW